MAFLPLFAIFPTFWLAFAPINLIAGVASGLAVTALVVFLMLRSSPRILVELGRLSVAGASVETKYLGEIEIISRENRFAERGPKLNANAFLALQPSQKGLLKVHIIDPRDATPYWLFSSKNPASLVVAIKNAKG